MRKGRKMLSLILIVALLAGLMAVGRRAARGQETALDFGNRETLYFWYTDDTMSDFLAGAAVEFYEATGIRVIPVLASGLEYLESINHAAFDENSQTPDLYIVSNDALEKAYLAGLAVPVDSEKTVINSSYFPEAAIHAVTYEGKTVGYPLYYECSALLYNRTYIESMAQQKLEQQADQTEGEAAQEAYEEAQDPAELTEEIGEPMDGGSSEELTASRVAEQMEQMIPGTVEEIETFADQYDAPEGVEAIFKWDVSDIFYNYFFTGAYLNVGGPDGDDPSQLNIYNEPAVKSLMVYQNLRQFFSIDAETTSYDSVLQEFMDGKLVFTIATTDAAEKIEAAKREGIFPYEYGVAGLPDLTGELQTKGLSVTDAVAVNGYSEHRELAERFAVYLCRDRAQGMYERCGKVPAKLDVNFENPRVAYFMEEYRDSVPMPKMMATSNFWVKMEIAFTQIWSGADAGDTLQELAEEMKAQINGSRSAQS